MSERKGVMLAKVSCLLYLNRMPEQVFFQPKINGNRCRTKWINDRLYLLSSQGNSITSCNHIRDALESVLFAKINLDGELYHPELSFQKISGLARREMTTQETRVLEYHVFDTINEHDQHQRLAQLSFILKHTVEKFKCLKLVKTEYDKRSTEDLYFEKFTLMGFEGLIIRNPLARYQETRTCDLLKKKIHYNGIFDIVGAFEALDIHTKEPTGRLGGLHLYSEPPLGKATDERYFKCGAGCLTHLKREELWKARETLTGKSARILYSELTDRGVPFHPILRSIE